MVFVVLKYLQFPSQYYFNSVVHPRWWKGGEDCFSATLDEEKKHANINYVTNQLILLRP